MRESDQRELDNKVAIVTGAGGGTVAHVPGFARFGELFGPH